MKMSDKVFIKHPGEDAEEAFFSKSLFEELEVQVKRRILRRLSLANSLVILSNTRGHGAEAFNVKICGVKFTGDIIVCGRYTSEEGALKLCGLPSCIKGKRELKKLIPQLWGDKNAKANGAEEIGIFGDGNIEY